MGRNGISESSALAFSLVLLFGVFPFLSSQPVHAASFFVRGDIDQDQRATLSDAVQVFRFLFRGPEIAHSRRLDALDVDDSNVIDITDGVRLLLYLFADGQAPADPFPDCDGDPSADELGCVNYDDCGGLSRFVYVIDRSSSTCNGSLAIWKNRVTREIRDMPGSAHVAVVFYDQGIRYFPPTTLLSASPNHKDALESFVASTQCGRGACLKRGLLQALTFLRGESGVIRYRGNGSFACPNTNLEQYLNQTIQEFRARSAGFEVFIEVEVLSEDTGLVAALQTLPNVTVTVVSTP